MADQLITVRVWTEKFLGTTGFGDALLEWIQAIDGGRWTPQRWAFSEPIRTAFELDRTAEIVQQWAEQRTARLVSRTLYLKRRRPNALLIASSWRSAKTAQLNSLSIDLPASAFTDADALERVTEIMVGMVKLSGAVYGTARHGSQALKRIAPGTPLERLEQVNWLNWFGGPYLALFGGIERVFRAPAADVSRVNGGALIVAVKDPRTQMCGSSAEPFLSIEEYLGRNAFAGYGYPEMPCSVPRFDFSDVLVSGGYRATGGQVLSGLDQYIAPLAQAILSVTERQLEQGPDFQPFGAVQRETGEVELIVTGRSADFMTLVDAVQERARDRTVRVAGVCNVRAVTKSTAMSSVHLMVQHRDSAAVDVVIRFSHIKRGLGWADAVTSPARNSLFPKSGANS